MNHKHVQVIIEDLMYSGILETQEAINDLIDYVECVEKGDVDEHYTHCVENKEEK